MAGWMKKTYDAVGVTEWPPGPELDRLVKKFAQGGAVYLLIDVSGSMGKRNMESARQGGIKFIHEAIGGGYEVGVILWHHRVKGSVELSKDPTRAIQLLKSAKAGGGTTITPAIELARDGLLEWIGHYSGGDAVIAVFGDGDLGVPRSTATSLARQIHAEGIRVLTLGLGEESAGELSAISTAPFEDDAEEVRTNNSTQGVSQTAPKSTKNVTSSESLENDLASMARGIVFRSKRH